MGVQPRSRVQCAELTLRDQFAQCRFVGTNRLALVAAVSTLGQRAVVNFGRARVEVARQGNHEHVAGNSRWVERERRQSLTFAYRIM